MNEEIVKDKFARILTHYYPEDDVSSIEVVIFEKETYEIADRYGLAFYFGKRDLERSWDYVRIYNSCHDIDPTVEWPTKEEYINNWTPLYEIDVIVEGINI